MILYRPQEEGSLDASHMVYLDIAIGVIPKTVWYYGLVFGIYI